MKRAAKEVPAAFRHVVRATDSGFELMTWYGYVLKHFETRADADAYYAWHCMPDPSR